MNNTGKLNYIYDSWKKDPVVSGLVELHNHDKMTNVKFD